jgi:hypothetical protein
MASEPIRDAITHSETKKDAHIWEKVAAEAEVKVVVEMAAVGPAQPATLLAEAVATDLPEAVSSNSREGSEMPPPFIFSRNQINVTHEITQSVFV